MANMSLKERLREDLTTAIKARDGLRSSTLRMVLTSITNAEVAGKESRELTDEDVLGVLTSESKKRREAAEAFADAGRDEQAEKEKAEAAVIADYLPEQLTTEEIDALVKDTIDELGVRDDGMKAMGRVMGVLTPKTKGRADGGAVAAAVRRELGA
ncbi:GatB/YqeY domain-containing protein [Marmoricola sp. URHB0036]|uniref:GatB/YqeY domain-containing protein n=1 Tax=Marmoricola sp. URHB0036 TaxID=1298863 RepID=UPI00040B89FC|nr:GatB/YqeY domain-containing protein [Marmoricola sp. URHB0036]